MRILVQMTDGRTVHLLERRADFLTLVTRKPTEALDARQPIAALTRRHVDGGFEPSRLLFLRASSVAQVEQVLPAMDCPAPADKASLV